MPGIALSIFCSIIFFDLKSGPIYLKILLEKLDASLRPNNLNIKKKIEIIKNCKKYISDFIYLILKN